MVELACIVSIFREAGSFLGIFDRSPADYFRGRASHTAISKEEIERLIKEREEARKNKDFKKADGIRHELLKNGILLEDTARGTVWTVKS